MHRLPLIKRANFRTVRASSFTAKIWAFTTKTKTN
jgi:hypothetical protein